MNFSRRIKGMRMNHEEGQFIVNRHPQLMTHLKFPLLLTNDRENISLIHRLSIYYH